MSARELNFFHQCLAVIQGHSEAIRNAVGIAAIAVGIAVQLDLVGQPDQFLVGQMAGKLANIGAEMPMIEDADESMLKLISSFEAITVDKKYRDPVTVRITAKLLFLTNKFVPAGMMAGQ